MLFYSNTINSYRSFHKVSGLPLGLGPSSVYIINSFNVTILMRIHTGIISASVKSGSSLRKSGRCKNLIRALGMWVSTGEIAQASPDLCRSYSHGSRCVGKARSSRGKLESELLGQGHTWGLTAKIQPAECGSVFRLHNYPEKPVLLVSFYE